MGMIADGNVDIHAEIAMETGDNNEQLCQNAKQSGFTLVRLMRNHGWPFVSVSVARRVHLLTAWMPQVDNLQKQHTPAKQTLHMRWFPSKPLCSFASLDGFNTFVRAFVLKG
eukprot:6357940-Amphidinium_carterae.1